MVTAYAIISAGDAIAAGLYSLAACILLLAIVLAFNRNK